jgi:hypothetical protein
LPNDKNEEIVELNPARIPDLFIIHPQDLEEVTLYYSNLPLLSESDNLKL